MKNTKKYNIGLDIGVGSVGWCVTDENNNILKRNGKNMWGSRIFDEAQSAKGRRQFRSSKRRLNRRKERINILQNLMIEDIEKEYPNFIPMLKESSNIADEKTLVQTILGKKYNLFAEDDMTDSKYYASFPTIYHLRKDLITKTERFDIRLVYLAIHHIIKYRGNFLHEGDFADNTREVNEKINIILAYLEENYNILLNVQKETFFDTLKQQNSSKAEKKEKLLSYFDYEKEAKPAIVNVINSFLGYTFDITKIFEIEIEKNKISFTSELENEEEILGTLGESADVFEAMKTIYSWYILQDILNGKEYISEAFIEKYKKYSNDLKVLKQIYKLYFPSEYNKMFRLEGENNYVSYNGKNAGKPCKKCKPEDFIAALKKKILTLPDECAEKQKILTDIENDNFLKKINVTDNGAIPHQLHEKELKVIIENQSKYYKTLSENKNNIIKLFEFRIPYYVGPLATKDEVAKNDSWSWVVRKSDDAIRPWNFSDVVDEDATAEAFITRMTNYCTYIPSEKVMPKQSLLYSEFCVLNELNNIRINEKYISKDMKGKIIEKLFKAKKKVTAKMVKELYKIEGFEVKSLTGLSNGETFNSNMSSYIDMERILGNVNENNFEKCEKLIYWITIFEDKKILKRKIKNEYSDLSEQQIKELVKLRYTGWSRLSKKLLIGLKSYSGDNIMEILRKDKKNFMQIINDETLGFSEQLQELMPKTSEKIKYRDIAEMPTSPANKRAIWQTVCVVDEIEKIMKCEPENIYVEFARNEEQKNVMKDNRAKQLLKKYEGINNQLKELKEYSPEVYKELKQHQNDKTFEEKLYLYFIQNGKCLYSRKSLNIDELSQYEVDHILPQSYIKDDSIDNKALVYRSENQRKKDNLLLSDEIINKQMEWWKSLLDNGLIGQKKYYNLIRRKMFETDADREKFVKRQLVETRQITKYVTNLLINSHKNTEIYALRSELTHGFREKYNLYKNRNVNNYHHAQDAYILNVIGNILDQNWKGTEEFKYSDYVKKYFQDERSHKEKYGIIMNFIGKYVDIKTVKKVMNYKDCYISRMLLEGTGEFYSQTLYSPNDKKNNPVIPLKAGKSPNKYGGYSGENKAYYVIYGLKNQKGEQEYQLVGIPIQVAYEIRSGKQSISGYVQNVLLKDKEYSDFKIIKDKVLKNQQYLDENGAPMRFCSDTEIRSDKELIVNKKMNRLIYLMNSDEKKLKDDEKQELEENYEYMFDYLMDKIEKEYKCLENPMNRIKENKNKYIDLANEEKKLVINRIIDMIQSACSNLSAIGLGTAMGRMNGKNFNTSKLINMIFIDKSVTGMYERRYKINGVENGCSK